MPNPNDGPEKSDLPAGLNPAVVTISDPVTSATTATSKDSASSHARATGIVSAAIMCSRFLGLAREIILNALFAGEKRRWLDCFVTAFRTPNMLRDLFAEGALSSAFVTTFSQKIEKEGEKSAWVLAEKMATLTAVFMSLVAIAGVLLAPFFIRLLAPGFDEDKIEFTVLLARIMFPFILIVSLSALAMGMLNAKRIFGPPALASSFFNLGSIITGVAVGYLLDPEFGRVALIGFAIGTLVGGLCQLGFQLPWVFKTGFRLVADFRWRDPGVKKILHLMWPAVIAGSAVQVNVLLNTIFASYCVDGSMAWLSSSFRLMQLPLGIFGVAVAMVTLPAVSRAATEGITPEFIHILSRGLRLVVFLTIPASIGLFILADPIISLVFERGSFNEVDRTQVALALRFYAVSLAFYAIGHRFVPMFVSLGSIAVNAGLSWFFIFHLDKKDSPEFLALSTGIVAILNFLILYAMMRHYTGRLETSRLLLTLGKILASATLLAGASLLARQYLLTGDWFTSGTIWKILTLVPAIGIAGALFFAATHLLNVPEMRQFTGLVKRKFGRG